MATIDDFQKLDIRVGKIISAEIHEKARKPMYKLKIDFGEEIGLKNAVAGITEFYKAEDLVGKTVVAIVNLEPKTIAGFTSECMTLGALEGDKFALLTPDKEVKLGSKIY
ncbi:MAG: tRNA-binding protein [Nanoarchaeota archaeon]|nr:tRNA-binding protein [Nanoarchaeota archaeon]